MNFEIWFDTKEKIGRARFTGTFKESDGMLLLDRLREIFKGREPCNLLIDIPEDDKSMSGDLLNWFGENAWKLDIDRIAFVGTLSHDTEETECNDA